MQWSAALGQIARDESIEEIILSGGDPLTLVDSRLEELVFRLADIPHLRRLRVHTRLPIVIPGRVTESLLAWLRGTRLVPVMVVYDAFSLSHTSEAVEMPPQAGVDRYLPPYRPAVKLDPADPRFFGGLVTPNYYMEHRWLMEKNTRAILKLAAEAGREYGQVFGRSYPVIEKYKAQGAELLLLATGTIASTAKDVIDAWRAKGRKVGLVRPRLFRPYPQEELRKLCAGLKRLAVVDRDNSFGSGGVWTAETRSALYDLPEKERPEILSYIAGLGGRDVTPEVVDGILQAAWAGKAEPRGTWVGLKP